MAEPEVTIRMRDSDWEMCPHPINFDRAKPVRRKGDPQSAGKIVDGVYKGEPLPHSGTVSYKIVYTVEISPGRRYDAKDLDLENVPDT